MFDQPFAFVGEPGNFDWGKLELWKGSPFKGFAVLHQNGPDRVNVDAGVRFRDTARRAGFKVAQWVNLETPAAVGRDALALSGQLAHDIAPHWDGTVVDAELLVPPDGCLPFLAAYTHAGPLALSTTPTFAMGVGAAAWDQRKATLCQQCYVIENGWTCVMGAQWTDVPPLYVGWYYRASINQRGRRIRLEGMQDGFYRASSIDGPVLVHPTVRSIRFKRSGKVVGKLEGVWNPGRWAPTMRTTPKGSDTLDPWAAMTDVRAALKPPAGIYLAETTPDEFLRLYRP
jgi:hypothetical protein